MSNQTSVVFSNRPAVEGNNPPQVRQQRQSFSSPAAAPQPKSGKDIIREMREKRARQEAEAATVTQTAENTAEHNARVEDVYARFDANAQLTLNINDLNRQQRRHPKGSAAEQTRQDELDSNTEYLNTVTKELKGFEANHPLAYEEGLKRYNRRLEAREMADANGSQSATPANIRGRIDAAVSGGFVGTVSQDDYEYVVAEARKGQVAIPAFSFDRKYFTAAKPWDPEAVVAVSISEMIADLQSFNDTEDEKIMAEVRRGGFFVSTRRDPDGKGGKLSSELDLFKKESGSELARRAGMFLSGKGRFYVLRAGKEFVVLENRDGKFLAVKVSGPHTGRVLCTVPDRAAGENVRTVRKTPAVVVADGHTVSATDLSGIWWDKLRQAFEQELEREGEMLTFAGLRANDKGSYPVSVYWKTGEGRDPNGPEVPLRGKLMGSGNGTFQALGFNPAILTEVDPKGNWLAKAARGPVPLETLDSGRWLALAGLNKTHERDWQLDNLAEEHDAIRVSTDNVDSLTGVENGKDGVYAVRAMLRKPMGIIGGERKYRKNPVGYLMERSGSTVEIVGAVPGTSVSYADKLRGKHEIANLPWRLKVILGSCYYGVRRQDAPEHLRLTKVQEEVQASETAIETETAEE